MNVETEAPPVMTTPSGDVVPAGGEAPRLVTINHRREVNAAVGLRVRVQGIASHQKLGDTVNSGDLSVLCINPRFPSELIGKQVVVEGVLELEDYSGTSGPNEVITAGTAPGRIAVIYVCSLQ